MMDVVNENKKESTKPEDVWWEKQITDNQDKVKQMLLDSFDLMGK